MAGFTGPLKKILRQNGCHFERQGKGDHEIWYSPRSGKRFPVDSDIKSRRQRSLEAGRLAEGILSSSVAGKHN